MVVLVFQVPSRAVTPLMYVRLFILYVVEPNVDDRIAFINFMFVSLLLCVCVGGGGGYRPLNLSVYV